MTRFAFPIFYDVCYRSSSLSGVHLLSRFSLHRLKSLVSYVRIFGLTGLYYACYVVLSRRKKLVRVARRWSRFPLYVRLNSSDVVLFRHIFIESEYEIVRRVSGPVEVIIDAGANIGLASVFIAGLYPDARIYALEPEDNNFHLLCMNTAPYKGIFCIQGALWHRDEQVRVLSSDAGDWAFRVGSSTPTESAAVRAFRVSSLLADINESRISLLKMDIEGAEWEVLSDAPDWIDKVDGIVIELHENLKPGCTDLFRKMTGDFVQTAVGRELTVVSRPQHS